MKSNNNEKSDTDSDQSLFLKKSQTQNNSSVYDNKVNYNTNDMDVKRNRVHI